jgi:ATP-dependent Clp protease protease subunit
MSNSKKPLLLPIGVPKIPYRLPGEEDDTWVDLYNVLYRERNIFLMQEIQDEITGQILGILTNIQIEEGEDKSPIHVFINSPGGSIFSGLGIYDSMLGVDPPISTYCMGLAASMATIILLGGDPSERLLAPNSRLMIHQPVTAYYDGQAGECAIEAGEILRMRDQVSKIYRQQTGKFPWEIGYHLERDLFLSPHEAISYGLADAISYDLPYIDIDF